MIEKVSVGASNSGIINKFAQNADLGVNFRLPAQTSVKPNDIVEIKESENNNAEEVSGDKKKNLLFIISASGLLTGAGLLVLTKGLPKNTTKYLNKAKDFLEQKLEQSKFKGTGSFDEFYVYSIRKINSFTEKAQSLNNINPLKDVLFKKLMYKNSYTKNIHEYISEVFERLSRSTVIKSYKKSAKLFERFYSDFDKLDESILKANPEEIIKYKGKEYTKRELVELAKQQRNSVKSAVSDFISEPKSTGRYKYIKTVTSSLYEKFWDKSYKDFWTKKDKFKNNKFRNKEMWQTFIPEQQVAGDKKILIEEVSAIRNKITYTQADKYKVISNHIKSLENILAPSDKEGFNIIKKLEWFLKSGDVSNKEAFMRELKLLSERPFEEGLSEVELINQTKLRKSYIDAISDLLNNKNCGELQEMLSIYETLAPYELSLVKSSVKKAVKSFDKSLELETSEFFDKVRDFQLGSAPTDILSILGTAGMITYGLGAADNKDERISIMLKSGIPIVGAVATSLICTAKLISGGKAMAFAGVSGLILNAIGSISDKMRLKYNKNHSNG